MVRVARGHLERAGERDGQNIQLLRESQRALLDSIGDIVSTLRTITYRLSCGSTVRIYSEDHDSFSLHFNPELQGIGAGELHNHFFPFQEQDEQEDSYNARLLLGIESFIDELALGEIVAIDHNS